MIQIVESIPSVNEPHWADPAFYFVGGIERYGEIKDYRRFLGSCILAYYENPTIDHDSSGALLGDLSMRSPNHPISAGARQALAEIALNIEDLSNLRINNLLKCNPEPISPVDNIKHLRRMRDMCVNTDYVEWVDNNGFVGDITHGGVIAPRKYDIATLGEELGHNSSAAMIATELGNKVDGFVWKKAILQEKASDLPEIFGEYTQLVKYNVDGSLIPVATI